jgi:hypothetical protein
MQFVLDALHAIPEGSLLYNAQPALVVASQYTEAATPGGVSTATDTTGILNPIPEGAIQLDISSILPGLLSSPSQEKFPIQPLDVPDSLQRELTGIPSCPVIHLHVYREGNGIPYLIT